MQAGQKHLGRPPIEAALLSPGAVGTRPVDVHLHRIYRKLGIANRTALAVRANNQTL